MKILEIDTYILDYNEALKRFGGDEHLTLKVIELFCSLTPDELEGYRLSTKQQKIEQVKNHAHKIKSRLQFLGCDNLAKTFESIELAAESEVLDLSQINRSIEQLKQVISSAELILDGRTLHSVNNSE